MQQPSPLLNLILQQNLSGLPDKDFLQQVTNVYPYFTPAQFYLLQQLPQDDMGYNKQAAKTAVLFNNPYLLHNQLQQKTVVNANEETIAAIPVADEMPAEIEDISPQQKPAAVKENTFITAMENPTPEQIMLSENKEYEEEPITEDEIAPMKITLQMPEIKNTTADALTFEPMHLVDYFASQGIKLSEEVQTADKLGKQLKSFTEWLKTMKKIHVPAEETGATHSDIIIQTMAEKSNTENEVLTEAMADVLAQQGKAGKAIELYKKLSLLNPSKIAYFAAKIEQLKGV
jgi:hypothetical protein